MRTRRNRYGLKAFEFDTDQIHTFTPRWLCFAEGEGGEGEGGAGGEGEGTGEGADAGDGAADAGAAAAGDAAADAARQDWRTSLPEDLQPFAKNMATPTDAVKTARELRQKLSKAIVPVDDKSSPEEIAAYRKAMGVPDAPEGYDVKPPEGLPDHLQPDQEMTAAFHKAMHEAGVPQSYVQAASDFYWNNVVEMDKAMTARSEQEAKNAETALRQEWAGDFDTNKALMEKGLERYPAEFKSFLQETGLGNNPVLANVLRDIGAYSAEDPMVGGLTADEAASIEEQRAAIRDNPDYHNRQSPNFEKLHQKMQELTGKLPGVHGPIVGREGRTV